MEVVVYANYIGLRRFYRYVSHLMKVVNLTGFTVLQFYSEIYICTTTVFKSVHVAYSSKSVLQITTIIL